MFILSFFKVITLKVRNGKRIRIAPLQQLHHSFSVKVKGFGKVVINRGIQCRRGCTLLCEDGVLNVGKRVFMNQNVMITCKERIEIGDDVTIANNVVIVDHDHCYKSSGFIKTPVSIGNNTWIGANSVIMRGSVLGEHCVVAAGTLVKSGIYPPYSLIYNQKETVCVGYKNK
jgi:acetyltransferase-like isoleucine patch superfamily enzyme